MVVFEEIPNEVTLAINITNCPCHCKGCHSKFLWEDVGTELTIEELDTLLEKHDGVTCVCFMGHGKLKDINYVISLADYVKKQYKIKVGLYTGFINIRNITNINIFDFIKEGKYMDENGGLNSIKTNQRFFKNVCGHFEDFTYLFWNNYKFINDYPYLVFSDGKIYSLKNHLFLKPSKNKKGYLKVKLYNGNQKCCKFVHRLVAEYFLPNYSNDLQVNHINENKEDNRFENLEMCFCDYNNNYGNRNRLAAASNSYAKNRKHVVQLSLEGEILNLYNSAVIAAKSVNGSPTLIRDCCNGGRYVKSRDKFVPIYQAYGYKWKYEETKSS